jgi:hypothetical protein
MNAQHRPVNRNVAVNEYSGRETLYWANHSRKERGLQKMRFEELEAGKTEALDALIPESAIDKMLLYLLLQDTIATLIRNGLISSRGCVHQGQVDDKGEASLELNYVNMGRLHRLSTKVCFCVVVEWDGERENRRLVEITYSNDFGRPLSLTTLLEKKMSIE